MLPTSINPENGKKTYQHSGQTSERQLVILLGGEAWSSFLHLEDEKYRQLPVFCAMASRNGIRIPEDSIDIRTYEPQSIDLTERMNKYNIIYCNTYEYDIDKDIEMMRKFLSGYGAFSVHLGQHLQRTCRTSVGKKEYETLSGNIDDLY